MFDIEIETPDVLEMRELLRRWLSKPGDDLAHLIDWLQGKRLPTLSVDVEPYEALLQGLPLADERHRAETALADRASRLLETQPDLQPGTEKLVYNLLMLCSELSCPSQLADQLFAMFQRRKLEDSDLIQALENSLIANQRDNRLEGVWQEMIAKRGHDFLTGDEYAGLEGVRLMPASEDTQGEPALDVLGSALAVMAELLKSRRDRRAEFHRLINRFLRTYPLRPTWAFDLVVQADKNSWPTWAFSCLPTVVVLLPSFGDRHIALVWEVYLVILGGRGTQPRVEKWLCRSTERRNGLIAKALLTEDDLRFLYFLTSKIESYRLTVENDNSYRAVLGQIIEALLILEEEAKSTGRSEEYGAEVFKRARTRLLIEFRVVADPNLEERTGTG